jgi:hypothetical protein
MVNTVFCAEMSLLRPVGWFELGWEVVLNLILKKYGLKA